MGRRAKDSSHSSHRQGAEAKSPASRYKHNQHMIDHCVVCGFEVLWEEAMYLNANSDLLVHPECAEAEGLDPPKTSELPS